MTAVALPAVPGTILGSGLVGAVRAIATPFLPEAPTIIRERSGGQKPPPGPDAMLVDIHRQPLTVLVEWQEAALALWRAHRELSPALIQALKDAGILDRCVVLSSDAAGQLAFRRIGEPTLRFFGRAWAEERLGRPHIEDPFSVFAQRIDAEYREAIDGGEPVHNRLVVHGLAAPFIYSHLLLGYALSGGRKAVFALVDY